MKKIYLQAASCLLLLAGAVYATSQLKNDSLFNANVEALTQDEIITGPLCMQAPGYACTSLDQVYEDHYSA